jgi:DNA-binding transcriptional regulator YdaS (Cro superfamily)
MSLIDYAKTERQREAIKAWQDCGEVVAKAAGVLGVSPSTVRDHIGAVKNYAAQRATQAIGMLGDTFLKAR